MVKFNIGIKIWSAIAIIIGLSGLYTTLICIGLEYLPLIYKVIYIYALILSLLFIISGVGLLKLKSWARKIIITCACLQLITVIPYLPNIINNLGNKDFPPVRLFIKVLFQIFIGFAILIYFNRLSVRAQFRKSGSQE